MEADANAKSYDEISGPQIEAGSQFIRELNLSLGDKVLDMGCGTGHLTKYIADIVGPDGQAVGIDPDAERIKIAEEKSKEVGNLQFCVGSSVIGFPHDTEPYYDVHISTNAYHWVPDDEKIIYIQKAHRCLKAGGKLAIWCVAKTPSDDGDAEKIGIYTLTQEGYRDMFQELGLFNNVVVDAPIYPYRYESFEEFKRWFKATTRQGLETLTSDDLLKKFVTTEDDGQVICKVPCIHITACKI
jgi:ubiquinone/menaquinone biosynthesis C-methylase UbiE